MYRIDIYRLRSLKNCNYLKSTDSRSKIQVIKVPLSQLLSRTELAWSSSAVSCHGKSMLRPRDMRSEPN